MTQILRLLFACLSFTSALSQSLYFKTGKNFTNYVFESSSSGLQSSVVKLKSDSGSFYELGAALPFGTSRFSYEFGISLNELNSLVESPSKAVKYMTEYVGLDNSVLFSIVKTKRVLLDAKLGFELQTLIFGKEEIGGFLYDLKQFDEFNGLFFRQFLGTQIKLVASNQLNFSVGYDFHYDVFNTKNNSNQSLMMNSNLIKFGMYYKLENKNNQKYLNQSNDINLSNENEIVNNSNIEFNKKNTAKTSVDKQSLTVLNSPDVKLSRVNRKNISDVQVSTDNDSSSLRSTLVDVKTNKGGANEMSSTLGAKNTSISNDSRPTRVENRIIQSSSIVRQPSNGSIVSNMVKPVVSSPNLNNQNPSAIPSTSVAIKSLLNSNSKVEKVLQDKPTNGVSRIVKSTVPSSDDKSNTVNNSRMDPLTTIINRLNIIENKLNILEKKN